MAPAPEVTLSRGMWGQRSEALQLQMCNPLLFPKSLTKGDSSTAFRSLLIKSSLLLLGTYYISGLQDAQTNKPQGPWGLTSDGGEPIEKSVTRGPWGGDAEKRGERWLAEAVTGVIPGEILRWERKIALRVSGEKHEGDRPGRD